MSEDPRLSMDEVLELVESLPIRTVKHLAEGPLLPEKGTCRVCAALKPLLYRVPEAAALYGWHEFFEETPALDELTKNWNDLTRPEGERHLRRRALGEWNRVAGMLSYARCCVIYLAAAHELRRRS